MINDPIVEEVYQARQKIMDECGQDLMRWAQRLKQSEQLHRDRMVDLQAVQQKRRLATSPPPG
jgi:hypothetical protein